MLCEQLRCTVHPWPVACDASVRATHTIDRVEVHRITAVVGPIGVATEAEVVGAALGGVRDVVEVGLVVVVIGVIGVMMGRFCASY